MEIQCILSFQWGCRLGMAKIRAFLRKITLLQELELEILYEVVQMNQNLCPSGDLI